MRDEHAKAMRFPMAAIDRSTASHTLARINKKRSQNGRHTAQFHDVLKKTIREIFLYLSSINLSKGGKL